MISRMKHSLKSGAAALLLAAAVFAPTASAEPHTNFVYGSGAWADQTTATVIAINQAITVCQQSGGSVLFGYTVVSAQYIHPNWGVTVAIRCQYP
ncbi:hypothetical protein J5226_22075 [Lysobacter sp. K5869]|uniref:hypothetical protein n=1 Tax=Lysobacter sp. K5869 TaxID=2820808 RepID=UPI001C062E77|nr:hypothetical protein [Lysobacter sp. K5869]QWP76244.1 hypothetical protein J5226_22075 [Lysobacter sp. K5869]